MRIGKSTKTKLHNVVVRICICISTSILIMLSLSLKSSVVEASSSGSNTIPRSTRSRSQSHNYNNNNNNNNPHNEIESPHPYPPWNPSRKINAEGFLNSLYPLLPGEWEDEAGLTGKHSGSYSRKVLKYIYARIRQVPGDGNCLFHALSTCLSLAVNGTHADMRNTTNLSIHSAYLRHMAVDCLSRKPKRLLFLQGDEFLRAQDLVEAAASQYNMTGAEYCELMKRDSYWGGGPEIVALCNVLKRPIHVYELTQDTEAYPTEKERLQNPGFRLRRMACFGSPKFDRKEPLHILSADSRFPDVSPGRQMASGNHFLAMFPTHVKKRRRRKRKNILLEPDDNDNDRVKIRGGKHNQDTDTNTKSSSDDNNTFKQKLQQSSQNWFHQISKHFLF